MSCTLWIVGSWVWFIIAVVGFIWLYRMMRRDRMANAIIQMRHTIFDEANAEAERVVAEAHQKAFNIEKAYHIGEAKHLEEKVRDSGEDT